MNDRAIASLQRDAAALAFASHVGPLGFQSRQRRKCVMSVVRMSLLSVLLVSVGCAQASSLDAPACELPTGEVTLTSLDAPAGETQTWGPGLLRDYTSKCASPEQITIECDGNVMTISQRGYVETWTLTAPTEIDLDVVNPSGQSTIQRFTFSR